MKRRMAVRAAVLVAAGAIAVSCGRGRFGSSPPVILISIDTLRADHLPAYGYGKVKTPAIDALRKDAILYGNAYSHVPLTLPSHATMFTGLLPPQNGIRDNIGFTLSEKHRTIAEFLKARGYATGAAVSAAVLTGRSGISRGFDSFDDTMTSGSLDRNIGDIQRSGFETEAVAETWLRAHDGGRFFYFLHLYEPHTPYAPPEPFLSEYRDRPYDGEVATADAIVGKLIAFLKARGTYARALLILVSDHGEGLHDHGEWEHGILLYREALHVPVLVKLPGARRAGEREDRPVGLIDLFPTIAEAAGGSLPPGLTGSSLLQPKAGDRRIYSETFYPRFHFGWSDLASLVDARYHYIHGPHEELYDVPADPAESRNLAPSLPPPFRALRNALAAMDRPVQEPGASDPEQVKKLAALGYLGSSRPPAAGPLDDPREHLGDLDDLKEGLRATAEGRSGDAIAILQRLLQKNPKMVDGWGALANVYYGKGNLENALAALKESDRLQPASPMTLGTIATVYLDMNDADHARLAADQAVAAGDAPEAHRVLASLALHRKDFAEAERQARLASGGYRNRWQTEILLADITQARGDLPGALRQLDAIEENLRREKDSHVSRLSFLRGDILARMGRNSEAEAAFRDEIEHFPGTIRAWTGLAILYASEGRASDAYRVLREMLGKYPSPRAFAAAGETLHVLGDDEGARRLQIQEKEMVNRRGSGVPPGVR